MEGRMRERKNERKKRKKERLRKGKGLVLCSRKVILRIEPSCLPTQS